MSKIIKEIIILLLVCLVGMLLFSVIFYEYIQIVKTFEVTSSDLNNFKVTKDYVAGKANPFAAVASDAESNATTSKSSSNNNSSSSSSSSSNSSSGSKSTNETTDADDEEEQTSTK